MQDPFFAVKEVERSSCVDDASCRGKWKELLKSAGDEQVN